MAVSDQQKIDFLLKKIGFTKTKTGSTVGTGAISGTPKQPFAEALPSPLVVPNSSLWNEADSIPATPPGSDTSQVKVYATASAVRMTADATSSGQRAYIAYSTYNNTSSARLTNWIDTQFGALYLIKVFKGDPNSGGVALSSGATNENWFFDYSAGVLNFNDSNVPSGVTDTNIYIVGYRYVGQTGAPTSGISTFSYLDLAVERNLDVGVQGGISTFRNNIDSKSSQNKIPFLYSNMSDLPSAGTYHGMFAHVHATGRGYFAHAGGWHELLNVETNGNVGTGTQRYLLGSLVSTSTTAVSLNVTGISTFAGTVNTASIVATGIDLNGDIDVDGHTNLDNVSVAGVTTFSGDVVFSGDGDNITFDKSTDDLIFNDGTKAIFGTSSDGVQIFHSGSHSFIDDIGTGNLKLRSNNFRFSNTDESKISATFQAASNVELYHAGDFKFETTSSGVNVSGTTTTTGLAVSGVSTFTGAIDANGDLDVDGHTNLDNVSIAGVTTGTIINATTFVGNGDFVELDVDGHTNLDNVSVAGVTTFASTINATTINSAGAINLNTGSGSNVVINRGITVGAQGISVSGGIHGSNLNLSKDLDVDGHTNLDNVSVAGVSTFSGNINLPDSVSAVFGTDDDGSIKHTGTNLQIFETTGNIQITNYANDKDVVISSDDGSGGTTSYFTADGSTGEAILYNYGNEKIKTTNTGINVTGNTVADGLVIDGNSDLNGDLDVDGHTNLDNVSIAGITTFAGAIDLNADLDVDGHTNLDNISVAGVSTFAGDATFNGNVSIGGTLTYEDVKNVDSVGLMTARAGINVTGGVITALAAENKIPFLYSAMSNLPNAGTYHGMFAHVHATARGYFAHAGNWMELVNKEVNGVVGTGTETYNIGNLVSTSSTTTSLNVSGVTTTVTLDVNGDLDVDGHTNLDNVSIAGVTTANGNITISNEAPRLKFIDTNHNPDFDLLAEGGKLFFQNTTNPSNAVIIDLATKLASFYGGVDVDDFVDVGSNIQLGNAGVITATTFKGDGDFVELDVDGHTNLDNVSIAGVTTAAGNVDINADLDVDGHTNLDNVSITGFTTITDGRVRIISPTIANSTDLVTIQGGSSGMSGASDSYAKHGITFLANAYTSNNVTRTGAQIYMEKEGSWHQNHSSPSGYAYGALVFQTSEAPSGGTATDRLYWLRERLRISAHGNVGIGISRPTSRLHVSGNSLITGVSTFSGNVDINADIDVDGHTNLDNVSVAGVSTFAGAIDLNADLDVSGTIKGYDYLVAPHGGTTTITVTVANKTSAHRYHGQGSGSGYVFDGFESPFIKLTPGRTYKFDQSDSSNSSHPLYFYHDADKTYAYDDGVTQTGTPGSSGAYTQIVVTDKTPTVLHYMCENHPYMGNSAQLNSSAVITAEDAQIRANFCVKNSGISTFTGNVNISGVTATNGLLDINAGGQANTFKVEDLTQYRIVIAGSGGELEDSSNLTFSGTTLGLTGSQTISGDIDVNGHTNLDNVSVAGVTTFSGLVDINAGGQANTFKVEDLTSGRVVFAGTGGELEDSNNLRFDGSNLFVSGINVIGGGSIGPDIVTRNLKATGLSTFTGAIDANGDLDVDGHTNLDNLSVAGVSTFAGAATFSDTVTHNSTTSLNDDVTFTGASYNVLWDKSDNALEFNDDSKATFGTDVDLSIYHDGSNSYIDEGGTGSLYIRGTDVEIQTIGGNKYFTGINNIAKLYYANNEKLATTSTGINITGLTDTDTLTTGNATFTGTVTAGGSSGSNGQYLKSTGTGVAWANYPTARTTQSFTASAGQTSFSFSYNVGYLDVFVNGVKLSSSEFTATNGTSVVLSVGSFVGDIVELVSYNTIASGGGGGGLGNVVEDTTPQLGGNLDLFNKTINGTGNINITGVITATNFVGDGSGLTGITASGSGVIVKNSGSTVGTAGTINFGDNLSVSPASAGIVTITGSSNFTNLSASGIATFSGYVNTGTGATVGIGSTAYVHKIAFAEAGSTNSTLTAALGNNGSALTFTGGGVQNGYWDNAGLKIGGSGSSATSGPEANCSLEVVSTQNTRVLFIGAASAQMELRSTTGNGVENIFKSNKALDFITGTGAYSNVFRVGETEGSTFFHTLNFRASDASNKTVTIDAISGIGTFKGIVVNGATSTISNLNITGVVTATTFKGALQGTSGTFSSNVDITGDLDVDGHTDLDNVSVAGVVTATTFVGALTGNASGNAATATALQNARTIGGVSFDGTANINLPGVNASGNQDTSGTAAVATNVTVSANNTTNETVYPVFVDGATGSQGAETDTGLTYNPSTGNLTATKFTGDGSGLTGITASGSGIVIKHDGSTVGTAGTINFGTNLDVSAISGGAVTITASGGGSGISTISGVVNIANDLDVDGHTNLDNLSVAGVSTFAGITTVTGNTLFTKQLGVSGVSTFANSVRISGALPDFTVDSGTFRYDNGKLFLLRSGVDARYYSGTPGGAKGPHVFYTHQGGSTVEMLRLNGDTGATLVGVMTATSFSGDGSNLTGVNANVGITTNLSGTFTASAGTPSTINTFGYSNDDVVVEYTVFIQKGSDIQTQKVLASRVGPVIHYTNYAVHYSSSLLVQCNVIRSGGNNFVLRVVPETGVNGSTTYKVKREVM